MRKPQLKESLLGWGGYQDLQDKIYLDKEVVYMSKYDTINPYSSFSYTRGTYYVWTMIPYRNWNIWTESPTPNVGDWVMYGNTGGWGYVQSVNLTENKITVAQGTTNNTQEYEFVGEVENMNATYGFSKNKVYSVNIDGEQNDKAVELRIYGYDNTKYNERFFFDKRTQCLVRTAYESLAPVSTYPSNENYVWKHMVFESYDPNTLERLDNHQVWGYSSQDFAECRKENVYQGLYSFYCNGMIAPEDGQSTGRMHPATVFVYSPRHKKVFSVEIGNSVNIENNTTTPIDYYTGIYNTNENLDNLEDLVIGLYAPHYNSGTIDQKIYEIHANLETNPVTCYPKSKLNLSTLGNPYTNNNYIAAYLNSDNCFITDPLDTTLAESFEIKFTLEINDWFLNDNSREIIIFEPNSTNAGAVIKLYHDNGQIKLGRFCRNIDGNLISDSNFILSGTTTINANVKYDIYWAFDGTDESLQKTDENGVIQTIVSRSTNIITDFTCIPTTYKIDPAYSKLYLTECSINFSQLTEGSENTYSTINTSISEVNPIILNENTSGSFIHTDDLYQCLPYSYNSYLFSANVNNKDSINKYLQYGTSYNLEYGNFNWENILEATSRTWVDAAYFNGNYYLIAQNGSIQYSSDGFFNPGTALEFQPQMSNITSITATPEMLIAINSDGYISTWSGSGNWSNPTQIASLSHPGFMTIRYNGSKIMAYSRYYTSSGSTFTYELYSATSTDATTWTVTDLSSTINDTHLMGDIYQGQFLLYKKNESYFTSSDGINWTEHSLSYNDYASGLFPVQTALFTFSAYNKYSRSTDGGMSWTEWAPTSTTLPNGLIHHSFYYNGVFFLFANPSSGTNYNTYISNYQPLTEEVIRHYSDQYAWNTFTNPESSPAYSFLMPTYSNMIPKSTASIYVPILYSDYSWKGEEVLFSSFLRKNTDTLESSFGSANFIDPNLGSGVSITNQPRSLCGPKYIQNSIKLSNIQDLGTIDGITFTKTNVGDAYAAFYITSSALRYTENKKIFSFVLVSENQNSVAISSTGASNYISKSFIYNGIKYYIGVNSLYYDIDNSTVNIETSLPNSVYLSGQIISDVYSINPEIESLGLYVLGKTQKHESYVEPALFKDYYSAGQNKLTYKYFYSDTNTTYTVQLYDAVTKDLNYRLTNELNIVPSTDKHMILTSTDNDGICRYLNLVSLELNDKYLIVPHTDIIDCNRNTTYLADNQTSSGSFSIKPVAIADGDLKPEEPQNPDVLYAWKRVSNDLIMYIYTDSLDSPNVVGKTFYYKDQTNHFYREEPNPYTIISSFQSSYITTQNGLEYTRSADYDWALNHNNNEYIPFYMKGWRA